MTFVVSPLRPDAMSVYVPGTLTAGDALKELKPFGPVQLTTVPFVLATSDTEG